MVALLWTRFPQTLLPLIHLWWRPFFLHVLVHFLGRVFVIVSISWSHHCRVYRYGIVFVLVVWAQFLSFLRDCPWCFVFSVYFGNSGRAIYTLAGPILVPISSFGPMAVPSLLRLPINDPGTKPWTVMLSNLCASVIHKDLYYDICMLT